MLLAVDYFLRGADLAYVPNIAGQDATDAPQELSENARVLRAEHSDPLGILGPHLIERDGAAVERCERCRARCLLHEMSIA